MDTERIRGQFKPPKVGLLLVGESPPDGGTFFYCADSALFEHTVAGFASVYGVHCPRGPRFLQFFKTARCYLEDLCVEPVNRLPREERREARREAVPSLSRRIKMLVPEVIVPVLVSIQPFVAEATATAGRPGILLPALPFPSRYHWRRYEEELATLVEELRQKGILPTNVEEV